SAARDGPEHRYVFISSHRYPARLPQETFSRTLSSSGTENRNRVSSRLSLRTAILAVAFRASRILQPTSPKRLSALFAALLFSGVALAQSQDPAGHATPPPPNQTRTQAPPTTPPTIPPTDPNAEPAQTDKKKGQPGSEAPITSPDTVTPKNSKQDVEAIGNRGVGKGINFYSIEKEMGLGKQL